MKTQSVVRGATPVMFIHGLWLHADSWQSWVDLFRGEGYDPVAPGWPGDSASVAETKTHPEKLANVGIAAVTAHFAAYADTLGKPIVIGHSFGGLIAQKLLAMGVASAAVAISPAQIRGVLPLPLAQLRSALPVLGNPLNYSRAVSQTERQFHAGFANAVSLEESNAIHARFAIPAPARPLFEAAFSNVFPSTAAKVDVHAERGPLLITGAGRDRTVPEVVARAAHRLYRGAKTVNDYKVFADRGHSLVVDSGWRDVAATSIAWLREKGM